MNDSEKQENKINSSENQSLDKPITPFRCFMGASISGALAIAAYLLTKSIVETYAGIPISFDNPMAARIASTVRTLIMGITTMATFVFVMVTVGLFALGIQLIFKKSNSTPES
ncbi:DUF3082 domain-containing protein [Cyanobacterium stanieri LEGE 03274]|uniref:DUF3082 domain-containing protein n=1 Tax=Cyanobacterium stanieri LEGE 03274 TaxID=1828756 RepID=A0ABR9V075_9CHRO|nr:DUF3082 domain-containing protein [Cyanobacterium stanieri]MBE9221280.1 DUF3082 domain-containing protein [Cyanobacterium stanieri LEGE 03274]